ncbi:hypothetical protein GJ496_004797 [Pomphorhynchus laevis]|nr:hypothetical protein GJ496_004797 [Pomphorhynchus laevis]
MTIELVRQGNYGKAMKRISSSRLAPFTEQTHRKLTDLHPPGKGIITSIPTAEHGIVIDSDTVRDSIFSFVLHRQKVVWV